MISQKSKIAISKTKQNKVAFNVFKITIKNSEKISIRLIKVIKSIDNLEHILDSFLKISKNIKKQILINNIFLNKCNEKAK